jgi:hypothetical protein
LLAASAAFAETALDLDWPVACAPWVEFFLPLRLSRDLRVTVHPQNWVFLGDSITEGIGSSPVSYATEIAALLREAES